MNFDRKPYIDKLVTAQDDLTISTTEMARLIGISYATLIRFVENRAIHKTTYKTLKRVKDFLNKIDEQYKDDCGNN